MGPSSSVETCSRDELSSWAPISSSLFHSLLFQPYAHIRAAFRQEIYMASYQSIVQCGSHAIPWYSLRRALANLCTRGEVEFGSILPDSLLSQRRGLAVVEESYLVSYLLWCTQEAQYSVDHDRIFALIGLLDPGLVALINIDYSLPVVDVFKNVCQAIIDHYADLSFLSFCERFEEEREHEEMNCPSWIPNWLRCSKERLGPTFASGSSGCDLVACLDGRQLAVFGVLCGMGK